MSIGTFEPSLKVWRTVLIVDNIFNGVNFASVAVKINRNWDFTSCEEDITEFGFDCFDNMLDGGDVSHSMRVLESHGVKIQNICSVVIFTGDSSPAPETCANTNIVGATNA